MDGGVGGSWKVECSVDDKQVDCSDFQENYDEGESFKQDAINYYTGVPAPAYLNDDDWFGPAPIRSQKQLHYMERETEMKRQERKENFSVEPDNIHEMMYNMATSQQSTTIHLEIHLVDLRTSKVVTMVMVGCLVLVWDNLHEHRLALQ